jgi:hypothetical protein
MEAEVDTDDQRSGTLSLPSKLHRAPYPAVRPVGQLHNHEA